MGRSGIGKGAASSSIDRPVLVVSHLLQPFDFSHDPDVFPKNWLPMPMSRRSQLCKAPVRMASCGPLRPSAACWLAAYDFWAAYTPAVPHEHQPADALAGLPMQAPNLETQSMVWARIMGARPASPPLAEFRTNSRTEVTGPIASSASGIWARIMAVCSP